jgi:hypothetical protein
VTCANQICYVVSERHRDALASCCSSNRLAQNLVILGNVKTSREQPQLHKRRDTGNLVNVLGIVAIIAVTSVIVIASLMSRSSTVWFMPDWSERQLATPAR